MDIALSSGCDCERRRPGQDLREREVFERQVEINAILDHNSLRYGKVDMRVKRALINRIPRVELDPAIAAKQACDWRAEALETAE